ncbi:hypothetical protein K1719_004501 [Acacia pycnantha]|nr:hypothetical protein K1719_004501 [Acacia pycnantha]
MATTAAASYALAHVTEANNSFDATISNIEKVEEVFSDPQVFDFFSNLTIDIENKRKVVDEIVTSSRL